MSEFAGLSIKKCYVVLTGYESGTAALSGTVKEGSVAGRYRVRLYTQKTGRFIAETWSSSDGTYSFPNISSADKYYVVAIDHTSTYNAVVKDNLTPG